MTTVFGAALLTFMILDMLWTTLFLRGAGPAARGICRAVSGISRLLPPAAERAVRETIGSICLIAILLWWLASLWLGWWLVFLGDPASVVHSQTDLPADSVEKAYFIGYTAFTLGLGDFKPAGTSWQLLTPIVTLTGLVTVTLSITYVIPVLSAATEQRQLALLIRDRGSTPVQHVQEAHQDSSIDQYLKDVNQTIAPLVHLHAQRHLTYPVIHFFRARERDDSIAINIAVLDEALTLIETQLAESARPPSSKLRPIRRAIAGLLAQIHGFSARHAVDGDPPVSSLDAYRVPCGDVAESTHTLAQLADRRRRLAAFVRDAGWSWDDVTAEP